MRYVINTENQQVSLETRNIEDYTRDELTKALLSAIGRAWIDRNEAIILATRHLGFKRTGSTIRKTFKSIINGAIRRGLLEYEGDMIRKV